MKKFQPARRQFLKMGSAALSAPFLLPRGLPAQDNVQKKFLFVIAASGGGSVIDSFIPLVSGPAAYNADQITEVPDSVFKAVKPLANSIQGVIDLGNGYDLSVFLTKHGQDMSLMTSEVSSVNHLIAARRAMTGDNVNGGRTIAEAVAAKYGQSFLLPNIAMTTGGYGDRGGDGTLENWARPEPVADPLMMAFATHGSKGIEGALNSGELQAARAMRFELEKVSRFGREFASSEQLKTYIHNRETLVQALEKGDTMANLLLVDPETHDFSKFNLQASPEFAKIIEVFPNIATDPFEAQVATGFLLAKTGLANAITVAPTQSPLITPEGTPNAPIAFDWSHLDHRGAQNAMWSYIMSSTDRLIDLLKTTDIDNKPELGKMWDHSFIYIATEFGRDKVSSGGSGHHLNNGSLLISPMLKGNRIFGGVVPETGLTFGFDPISGAPTPGSHMKEKHIYSAICQALGIEFDNRVDMSAVI